MFYGAALPAFLIGAKNSDDLIERGSRLNEIKESLSLSVSLYVPAALVSTPDRYHAHGAVEKEERLGASLIIECGFILSATKYEE